jgi:hypothetical protein
LNGNISLPRHINTVTRIAVRLSTNSSELEFSFLSEPSRYASVGNVRFKRNAGSRQQPQGLLPIYEFLFYTSFSDYLVMKDHSEVCSLSRGANLEPLSAPLQHGIRFLRDPIPASLSAHLATRFPLRERYGLNTLRIGTFRVT